jgi:hypothetical protein
MVAKAKAEATEVIFKAASGSKIESVVCFIALVLSLFESGGATSWTFIAPEFSGTGTFTFGTRLALPTSNAAE